MGGEEDMGKRVDMNAMFQQYVNLKKVSVERKHKFRDATYARLKRKRAELEVDDPLVDETMEEEYSELDYIEWLKTFDQFHDIPRFCKYREKNYTDYLEKIIEYLRGLLVRAQPMVGVAKLEQQFEKEFEERYADRSIPGWQESTHKEKLFCLPTSKLLKSEATRKSHMTGQLYKKRLGEVQKMGFEEQKKLVEAVEAEDKRIARLESHAAKWHDLLSDTIQETVQHLQKKQSQTVEEMQDDEDRPIYNPLNLPLGWDGKPIPFWLYKLHGLGIEYKCEICGNYSYWGRRAFERHFSEWRHAFGMRCLGIPNTSHFKEITKIEDAITLYEKLKKDAEEQTFRPDQDVECEDIQGNVMSQRAFEDLRRQGLV